MIIHCEPCSAQVDAKVLSSYTASDDENDLFWKISFLRCPQCDRPMITSQEFIGGDELNTPSVMFPRRDHRASESIEGPIGSAFREAVTCLHANAYTASTIMCRKSLEALCEQHGVKKGSLAVRLKSLSNKKIIDESLFVWAEELRLAGNKAAHDVAAAQSAEDATDVVDFTDAILQYVVTFRDRFANYQQRKAG